MQMHDTRTFLRNRWPSVARSDRVKRSVWISRFPCLTNPNDTLLNSLHMKHSLIRFPSSIRSRDNFQFEKLPWIIRISGIIITTPPNFFKLISLVVKEQPPFPIQSNVTVSLMNLERGYPKQLEKSRR